MLSILLASVIAVQDNDTIEFKADGERLDSIVARIADESGQALSVGPEGSKHYLVIRVNDSSWEEVLDGIAEATTSKWEIEDGVRRLVPDSDTRLEYEDKSKAKIASRFEEGIENWLVKYAEEDDDVNAGHGTNNSSTISPELALNFISQLLPLVDVNELVNESLDTSLGGRVVFSTRPTQMQRRFKSVPATLIPELSRSYNEYLDWYEADEYRRLMADVMTQEIDKSSYSKYIVWPSKESPLDTVNLVVRWFGSIHSSFTVYLELQGYSSRGGQRRQIFEFLSTHSPLQVKADDERSLELPESSARIEFGPELSEVFAFRALEPLRNFSDMPETYRQLVLNPERFDPQVMLAPLAIDAVFEGGEGDVIACVPDSLAWALLSPYFNERDVSLGALFGHSCRYIHSGNIHVLAPVDAGMQAENTVDRRLLGEFLRTYQGHVTMPLRPLVRFIDSVGNSAWDYPAMSAVRVVLGSNGIRDLNLIEILSHCDPIQLDQVLSGVDGRLSSLSPGFRTRLQEYVFSDSSRLAMRPTETRNEYAPLIATRLVYSNNQVANRSLEPTEVLPNGIPDTSVLRSRAFAMLGIIGHPASDSYMQERTLFNEYSFAYYQASSATLPVGSTRMVLSSLRFGEMTATEINIEFTDDLNIGLLAEDSAITIDDPAYTEEDIPESFKARIAKARELMASHESLQFIFNPRFGTPTIRP